MQVNKPKKQSRFSGRDSGRQQNYASKRAEANRRAPNSYRDAPQSSANEKVEKPKYSKEDALIDLYEDPFKRTREEDEQLIINIDFSKPMEILGQIYRQLKELANVAQSKITRENAVRIKNFVTRDKKTMAITAASTIAFVGLAGYSVFFDGGSSGQVAVQGESTGQEIELNTNPDFEVLVPNFRTREELAIAKVSPPNTPAAFAYLDVINGDEVQVTQQQLPDRFKSNQTEEFKSFAQGFAATEPVTGEGFTAYVGTSIEGPQSVVAIKNDLLILMKSKSKIETELWSQYLASLE